MKYETKWFILYLLMILFFATVSFQYFPLNLIYNILWIGYGYKMKKYKSKGEKIKNDLGFNKL